MASENFVKLIRKEIDQLLDLDGVTVEVLEGGFLPLGGTADDTLLSVVFEDSEMKDPEPTACRLEVVIRLQRCIYASRPRLETVITLGVEIPPDLYKGRIIVELVKVTNGVPKLTKMCERFLSAAPFIGANEGGEHSSLYKLVFQFYCYMKEQTSHGNSNIYKSMSSSVQQRGVKSSEEPSVKSISDYSLTGSSNSIYDSLSNSRRAGEICLLTRKESQTFYKALTIHSRYYREFKHEKVLGSGSFGCVTKVRRNGISYAVKQIPIYKNYGNLLHEEAAVLASLQHRNIVRYYDAWMENPYEEMLNKEITMQSKQPGSNMHVSILTNELQSSLQDSKEAMELLPGGYRVVSGSQRKVRFRNVCNKKSKNAKPIKYLYILMEYCAEENLFDAIGDGRLIDSPQLVVELFSQILEALSYIHEKGIIHRDIKPSNIFLKSEAEGLSVKLGDFGLTAKLSRQQSSSSEDAVCPTDVVGTLHYMSPEQARGEAYDEKVDIFAAGVVLFEMLSPPFSTSMERFDVLSSFSTTEKKWPIEFHSRIDNRLFKILESMLSVDPSKRPSASQLLQSEIFVSSKLDTVTLYRVISQYPHSMESTQLLRSIFSRREPTEKDVSYFDGLSDNAEVNYVNVELARRYMQEFRSRGAVRYEAPLFVDHKAIANTDGKAKDPYMLLFTDGRMCRLRNSILLALVQSIPQVFLVIMRRWYWGKIYHKAGSPAKHPNESWACAYNIIADYSILFQEMGQEEHALDAFFCAELMLVAARPLVKFMACSVTVEWTYASFIRKVLEDGLGIREKWSHALEEIIIKHHKRHNMLKRELHECLRTCSVHGMTTDTLSGCIMQVVNALPEGGVTSLNDFLITVARIVASTGRDLTLFNKFISSITYMERFLVIKGCTFVFFPLGFQPWHRSIYTKFSFRVNYTREKKTFSSLVSGGCINSMLPDRNGTLLYPPHRNVFGFEVNLQPLIQHFNQQEAVILGRGKMESLQLSYNLSPQVLICISHLNLLPQAMALEHLLQKTGIIVEKQLGFPGSLRKLQKHMNNGLINLSRLEIIVHIKHLSAGSSVSGWIESDRLSTALQYKVVYTFLGNEVQLNDEKEVLSVVCSHVYKRYL